MGKFRENFALALGALLTLFLCSCDYTRQGGFYRLTFQDSPLDGTTFMVQIKDTDVLHGLVAQWCSSNGFRKFDGKRTVWIKKGARIYVAQETQGGVLIEFFGMGYRRDLRLSQDIEMELVTYLRKQPGLKIEPLPRPKAN